jgi:hypothetical protein
MECKFERMLFMNYNRLTFLEQESNRLIGQIKTTRVSDYLETEAVIYCSKTDNERITQHWGAFVHILSVCLYP